MTEELVRQLMALGLSKQQATSVTAETLVNQFMNDDGKLLMAEAKRQVDSMKNLVLDLQRDYNDLKYRIDALSHALVAVTDAQEEYGSVSDEKAKNIIALYGALLNMNEAAGANGEKSVDAAGYILYAYLGGQAKRDVNYISE